jgi:hypothetical protein
MDKKKTRNKPTVLIEVRDGEVRHTGHMDVAIVVINWDRLAGMGTQGELCRIWKTLWRLPKAVRERPLYRLIALVEEKFPIMATFQPLRYATESDGRARPDGPMVTFDATEPLLLLGPDVVDNFQDRDYPTIALANDLPAQKAHDGPYEVEVRQAAMDFLFADENEAEEQKLREAPCPDA